MISVDTRTALRKEARVELADTADDLFYIARLYEKAGDKAKSQRITAHAYALLALRDLP